MIRVMRNDHGEEAGANAIVMETVGNAKKGFMDCHKAFFMVRANFGQRQVRLQPDGGLCFGDGIGIGEDVFASFDVKKFLIFFGDFVAGNVGVVSGGAVGDGVVPSVDEDKSGHIESGIGEIVGDIFQRTVGTCLVIFEACPFHAVIIFVFFDGVVIGGTCGSRICPEEFGQIFDLKIEGRGIALVGDVFGAGAKTTRQGGAKKHGKNRETTKH